MATTTSQPQYTEQDLMNAYEQQMLANQGSQSNYAYPSSSYGSGQKQNLVEWELDFSSELIEIERLLRCDVLVFDKNGNERWERNQNPERIFLNDLGVNDVLRKIKLLVNKNKVLSNYTIEEIKQRTRIIGHELRVLIYNNYESYGIDNDYKMHNYPMAVLSIVSIVEDTYRRALGGEGHKGLNEQRLVTQNEQVMPMGGYPSMNMGMQRQGQSKRWYNPFSWFK